MALDAAAKKCGSLQVSEVRQTQPHPNTLMLFFRCERSG
jgi:hypothetical protein